MRTFNAARSSTGTGTVKRRVPRAAVLSVAVAAASVVVAAAAAQANPPVVRALPAIVGSPVVGETLRATTGEWGGARPMTFRFQWRRCGRFGANCVDIPAATTRRYTVASADVGRTLRVRVTATNADGTASAVSRPTAVVRARGTPPPPPGPAGQVRLPDGRISIPVTSVAAPQRLVISEIAFSSNPVRSRRPFTARFRVTDTRGFVVRDALVFVLGVPYNRIRTPAEQPTATDGWATFTLEPTRFLPLRRGYYLVMFVRARKAGDNVLAGVSGRRLVQLRLAPPA